MDAWSSFPMNCNRMIVYGQIPESLQALTAAGVLPLKPGANASLAMTRATNVITACSAAFLAPALAAGVGISGLADLPKKCNLTGDHGSGSGRQFVSL